MGNKKFDLFSLIACFKLLIEIANFVCICILVHSSKNNPLENHIIGNLSNYFYGLEENEIQITNEIKYNDTLVNNNRIQQNILNIATNFSLGPDKKKKIFLRKLVSKSFCLEIRDNFERLRGSRLSSIFELNYNKIHNISIAILILSCILVLFILISLCLYKRIDSYYVGKYKCCIILYLFLFLLIYGTRFVLSMVLLYFMEKGDIEKYDDFLDCQNVKIKFFKNISDVNKLRHCFYAFVIMNFLLLGIEKIEKYLEFGEKAYEKENNQTSNISSSV